jgi:hypothetical protein
MMMRRFLYVFSMLVLVAGSLHAQFGRKQRVYVTNDPKVWVSGGIGGFRANVVNDGATSSTWNFANSTNIQYRASLEAGMANGSSFGIAGSWARVPFQYSSSPIIVPPIGGGTQCSSCKANLDMMTLVATFHSGAGLGLHQLVELDGGVVAYRNLKQESDGARLAPVGGNIDPLFSLGYGFGYGLSDRTNLDFLSTYTFAIHERKGNSNGTSNTNSMPSLRVSLRMGFGNRSVTR